MDGASIMDFSQFFRLQLMKVGRRKRMFARASTDGQSVQCSASSVFKAASSMLDQAAQFYAFFSALQV